MNYNKKVYLLLTSFIVILTLISCSNNNPKSNTENNNNSSSPSPNPKEEIIIQAQKNYSYHKLKDQINKLTEQYPTLKTRSIGKSIAGRELYLLKLGTGSKKIAIVAGVHGREATTSLLVLKLVEDYLKHRNQKIQNYNLPTILQEVSFYFIPMLNPDGVTIANQGIKSIDRLNLKTKGFYTTANEGSADFSRWKANGHGVDLNKQFPAHWEKIDSELRAHFAHYKGPSPESEPESKAIADLTRQENFSAVIAFHSRGQVIYWYYNQQHKAYQRDYQLAKKLSESNNYKLVSPQESDNYAAGYKDWFIKKFNRPGFTIEVGKKKDAQPLAPVNLNQYWQRNRTLLLVLATNI